MLFGHCAVNTANCVKTALIPDVTLCAYCWLFPPAAGYSIDCAALVPGNACRIKFTSVMAEPNPGGAVVSRAARTMTAGQVVLTPSSCGRAVVKVWGATWAEARVPAAIGRRDSEGFIFFAGGECGKQPVYGL